jgi:hypothetical protein
MKRGFSISFPFVWFHLRDPLPCGVARHGSWHFGQTVLGSVHWPMKQVFTKSSVIPCDLVKSMLEAAGIPAVIRHELGSAAAGYSIPAPDNPSLPWAWPEVWVPDDHYERAVELVKAIPGEVEGGSEGSVAGGQ